MKRILSLSLLFCMMLGIQAFGQSKRITGTVSDLFTGETLPGVTVVLKGTTVGTQTNMDGRYELTVPEGSTLVFSFVGMMSEEVVVDERSIIDVALSADIATLSEVIIVAYGTTTRESFTGSLSVIDSEKISSRSLSNLQGAIEGSGPGIQVSSASGQPGAGQNIRIRGTGSFSASNAPLYVVDGAPYPDGIANINPADIDNISVLKDAAATSLYGNRAANGVIIITTKRGRKDSPSFNINVSQGITSRAIPEYSRVTTEEYYPLMWEVKRNDLYFGGTVGSMEEAGILASQQIASELGYNPFNVPNDEIVLPNGQLNPQARRIYSNSDLDWEDALMRMGQRQNYSVNYSGGAGATDYFVSMGYLQENGFVIQSDFERFTGRINVNSQVKDWLRTGLNLSGTRSVTNNANVESSAGLGNPFNFSRGIAPIYPIYLQNPGTGEYVLDYAGNKIYDLGDMEGMPLRGYRPGRHVVAETMWDMDENARNALSTRTFAEFSFLNYFTFTTNIGYDVNSIYSTSYDNNIVGDGAPSGRGQKTNAIRNVFNANQLLNFKRSFNGHEFDVLLGHESYEMTYDFLDGYKTGVILQGNQELINYTDITRLNSYQHKYRSEGFLSRVNYNLDQRYYLTGSIRRDGSSKFHEDSRWGTFWSISGAWRLDREDFMSQYGFIDMLKPRVSYGEVGNDGGISYYAYQSLYTMGRNNFNEAGFTQSSLASPNLVWEANTSFGLGVDFILWGRVNGNIDYFHRESQNLLFEVPLPISSGMESTDMNVGTMYNRGLELRVGVDAVRQNDLNWNVDFNFTTYKNEFTHLPQDEIITGTKKLKEGQSIYDFWLRQWYGVDPSDGAALYYADNTTGTGIRVNGTDTLTTDHNNALYDYSGSAIPDLLGGVTNTISYKNFQLSVLMTFQVGGKVYDGVYGGLMNSGNYGYAMHSDISGRWQNEGDVTNVPRLDSQNSTAFGAQSTRWLIDASYLNVRSVNLTYRLPANLASNLGLSSANIYLNGENLHLWSKRKGMDPAQSFAGVIVNTYTPARIFTVGVNANF